MDIAYLVITMILAVMAAFSVLGKLRRDPKIVHVVREIVGVPLFPTPAKMGPLGPSARKLI